MLLTELELFTDENVGYNDILGSIFKCMDKKEHSG